MSEPHDTAAPPPVTAVCSDPLLAEAVALLGKEVLKLKTEKGHLEDLNLPCEFEPPSREHLPVTPASSRFLQSPIFFKENCEQGPSARRCDIATGGGSGEDKAGRGEDCHS